jgi:diguanylate cyclase (GGDEF)-like protein
VISIKRHLDTAHNRETSEKPRKPEGRRPQAPIPPPDLIEAYRAALAEMARSSVEACPPAGNGLQGSLTRLASQIEAAESPDHFQGTSSAVLQALRTWGQEGAAFYRQKAAEVKEIILMIAQSTEAVAERDGRYGKELRSVTDRMDSMARLEDLPKIRQELRRSASEMRACLARMNDENQTAVRSLQTQVRQYETRLEEAERQASVDRLTGIFNRARAESELTRYIQAGQPFSLVLIDLNGFKPINDTHGHQAGDDVLRQFATELKNACPSGGSVGRWGGDEFVAILPGNADDAGHHLRRLEQWVLGNYTIATPTGPQQIAQSAAIGSASWAAGLSAEQLVAQADAAMYEHKRTRPAAGRSGTPLPHG